MRIEGLKTNYMTDPLGIDLESLTFTWRVEDAAGSEQKSARFIVSDCECFKDILLDSGETDLPLTSYSPDLKGIVEPGKKYFWKVEVTDETGDHAVSETASFEGGIPEAFKGKWISPTFSRELIPVLRKTFTLTGEEVDGLASTRLYICGLGVYEAYLNGKKIGDQFLTPYFTDYRYWIQYQTYDVTELLTEGENTLDVWLGDGWYKGRLGYNAEGQMREYYGDSFMLLADLYLNGKDGSRQVISTDESFRALLSPVISDGIYDGEVYVAKREAMLQDPGRKDISPVKVVDGPTDKLTAMIGLPVIKHEELAVKEIIHTGRGETVLDFGQEITGWMEFTVQAPADTPVKLYYGEVMQDGNFYNGNLRSAIATYEYVSDGEEKVARPHFTFYGFRFVKVEGMDVTEENVDKFKAYAVYSDLAETGHITTGNEKINRLILNTQWSQKGNFLDVPSDCPQRDERLGWTGDAQIFSATACYHMETAEFYRKYMRDIKVSQDELGGSVPYVAPDILTIGRKKMAQPEQDMSADAWGESGSCVWGDAAVIIPWNLYQHYGNKVHLAEQYQGMKDWTDFIVRMDETYCGGKRLWTCGFHLGDWLSLDVEGDTAGMDHLQGGTDKYYVASACYMYAAELTAKAAHVLGKEEDAAYYENLREEVKKAMQDKYVTGVGELSIQTQTAYAVAIHFGLFETEEDRKAAGERLVQLLEKWNNHLSTGFVGTAYLCHALTETGHVDKAYTLLMNEDYPSWLYEVNLGATTTWERWNSILPDGHISGTGMNSLNHYAYGSIAQWIYEVVCGICVNAAAPGGKALVLTPHPDKCLGHASATVDLAAGTFTSGWEINGDTVTYTFEVPFGCSAKFNPDRELKNCTLNGKPLDAAELSSSFGKGTYVIKGQM